MTEVETMRKEAGATPRPFGATRGQPAPNCSIRARRKRVAYAARPSKTFCRSWGEAEREAHRLTSTARREAEDVLRSR